MKKPAILSMTKRVEYAYATSTNADRFGFKKGCYTVDVIPWTSAGPRPSDTVAGFATIDEARAHAETLPFPYDRLTK